jgi:glycosyltransferase involved in cell wall biosynthesis
MPPPVISVVMITQPSRLHFRKLALQCLAAQVDPPAVEVVIATDDGDHLTAAELAPLHARFGADHVKVIAGTWKTVPDKHNAVIAAASAPWFTFWDDDDWCSPDRLRAVYGHLSEDVDILGPDAIHYHELIGSYRRTLVFTTHAHVIDGAATVRRSLWERTPFTPSKSRHPNAARWGTIGDWIVHRAADRAAVRVVNTPYVAMVHDTNASIPARPFRVEEKTGRVLDGPLDYTLAGGRQLAAELMGEAALQAYEKAFAASAR